MQSCGKKSKKSFYGAQQVGNLGNQRTRQLALRSPKNIHLLSGEHGEICEDEKSGVLEHKYGNIAETRKDRGKVTMDWRAYTGPEQRPFELYHPRPPMASSSPRLGVRNLHPKLQSLLSQEQVKLRTSDLAGTFTGSSEQKPI